MISSAQLRELFATVRCVLLDFDGPVCSIFANRTANEVNGRLRALVPADLALPETAGPHETLQAAARISPTLARRIEDVLAAEELAAAETATPTPGAAEFLRTCSNTGRLVVIVSNNHGPAIRRYADRVGIAQHLVQIIGRDPGDPGLMKPNPHLVRYALRTVSVSPDSAALIGDSSSDIEASRGAGVRGIGYANKPGKAARLRTAGAIFVVASMTELMGSAFPS